MNTIYIVEDDSEIREMEAYALKSSGFDVNAFDCGKGLDEAVKTCVPDLIILDIMLPGEDGLSILRRLRAQDATKSVPVIMITAKGSEIEKVKGLDAGADDYIAKPFGILEFISRVKALLRRYQVYQGKGEAPAASEYIERAGIRVSREFNRVIVDGSVKNLTEIEYQLLLLMIGHPQKVFTAQELYEQIWKEPYFYSCSNTLMVHIRNLRMKIERNPQEPARICTVWGKGYMFNERNQ